MKAIISFIIFILCLQFYAEDMTGGAIWPKKGSDSDIVVKSGDNQQVNDKHFRWHSFQSQKMIFGTDAEGKIIVYPFVLFAPTIHDHHYSDVTNIDDYIFPKVFEADSAFATDHAATAGHAAHADKANIALMAGWAKHAKWSEDGLWVEAPLLTSPIKRENGWDYSEIGVDAGGKTGDILVIAKEIPNGIIYEWQPDTALPLDYKPSTYLSTTVSDTPVFTYVSAAQGIGAPWNEDHFYYFSGGWVLLWIFYGEIVFVFTLCSVCLWWRALWGYKTTVKK